MAFLENCIERAVGLAATCGWLALGGGPEAMVGVTISGIGIAAAVSQSLRGHGPESQRALKSIRKRIAKDLQARAKEGGWEDRKDIEIADAAMERALAGCFLDRKSLAASARSPEGFPGAATELILAKLAEREPAIFGTGGTTQAKNFAKQVIYAALEAAIENETYFKSLAPHLTLETLRGIGQIEAIVTEGFDDAKEHREQVRDEILSVVSDYSAIALDTEKIPDELPEPVLIEAARSLPKKEHLGSSYWNADQAVRANLSETDEYIQDPSKGMRWDVNHTIYLDYSLDFIWDVLMQTEYIGLWNPWVGKKGGKALPNKFKDGSSISEENDYKIIYHKCFGSHNHLVFSANEYPILEIIVSRTESARSKILMRSYFFEYRAKSIKIKLVDNIKRRFYYWGDSKIEKTDKSYKIESEKSWLLKAGVQLKNQVRQFDIFGRPHFKNLRIGSGRDDSNSGYTALLNSWAGVLKLHRDKKGNTLLKEGQILQTSEIIGFMCPDNGDYDEKYCKENFYLYLYDQSEVEVLKVYGAEGQHCNQLEVLGFFREISDGSANTMFETALAYETGDGIEQNYSQAAAWYAQASKHQHAQATHNLAVLYQNGIGVSKKPKVALSLFRQASALGHENAHKSVAQLEHELTPQDLS